jgi:hypothetical protein
MIRSKRRPTPQVVVRAPLAESSSRSNDKTPGKCAGSGRMRGCIGCLLPLRAIANCPGGPSRCFARLGSCCRLERQFPGEVRTGGTSVPFHGQEPEVDIRRVGPRGLRGLSREEKGGAMLFRHDRRTTKAGAHPPRPCGLPRHRANGSVARPMADAGIGGIDHWSHLVSGPMAPYRGPRHAHLGLLGACRT